MVAIWREQRRTFLESTRPTAASSLPPDRRFCIRAVGNPNEGPQAFLAHDSVAGATP
ncbi:hypothetical protein [Burkholderia latens]|uniref:hypothetical protein n=1 Tax=Burkholderia latens TaxID=488446 RepID=UPI001AEA68C0|nr:hypothetical protein [Burkholderia latens]QTO42635.1 hypothetical protein J8I85_11250 [Burkholderia latens]